MGLEKDKAHTSCVHAEFQQSFLKLIYANTRIIGPLDFAPANKLGTCKPDRLGLLSVSVERLLLRCDAS